MRIFTFSFSPTGTSAKILHGIAEGLSGILDAAVVHTDLTFKPADDIALSPDDIVVAAAPVYGGKIAPIAKQRLKGLRGNNARCIVAAIYGNRAFENAAADFASFMTEAGLIVCGAAAFVGEHSYSTAATPIASGRPDNNDMADARTFGREIASRILSGELREVSASSLADVPSPPESMVNFRNFVIGYQKRQTENPVAYLPQVDTSLCDGCGICYGVCPTEAIAPDCDEADPAKCIKCCACVKSCPQGARQLDTPFAKPLSENFNQRKSPVWIL